MLKKAVIIGAGQTGRGFIAPIIKDNGGQIVFIDKDKALIEQMNREKSYSVSYFGAVREKSVIDSFEAFTPDSPKAEEEAAQADIILVSVFAGNIPDLTDFFSRAAKRKQNGKMTVICCENGVNVKQPLIDAGIDAVISEGIIFCTTLKPEADKLDLISQDYPDIPIDGSVDGLKVDMKGMPLESDFASLIQRKIYTYNFISAIVAYLGSYKSYDIYGEAANDPDIAYVIEGTVPVISRVIAKKYGITYEEQLAFTNHAVEKFQNKEILDTIYRNARQVERKLRADERILTPLRFAAEFNEDRSFIELVTAAALHFGEDKEELDAQTVLDMISGMLGSEASERRITDLLAMFRRGDELELIIEAAEK